MCVCVCVCVLCFECAKRHIQWWPATVEEYRDGCQMHESERIWQLKYDEHDEFPSETTRVCFVSGDEMKTLADETSTGGNAPVTPTVVVAPAAAAVAKDEAKADETPNPHCDGETEHKGDDDDEQDGELLMHWRFENSFTLGEYAQHLENEERELRESGVDVPNVEDELRALPAAVAARVADGMRQFKDALADSIRRRYDASMLGRENEVTAHDAKAIIADVFSSIGVAVPKPPPPTEG